jgi:hypothetical protein
MIELKKIRGSQTIVPQLDVNIDTVYVRSNIMSIDDGDFKGWEYDEVQYKKDEYIELMGEKNQALEGQILESKLAMAELVEIVVGGGETV